MAVDLKKNGTDIKNASNDVMNDKTETDWALFGYEGQTNVVKLMSTGDGGLDELIEDFNPSKIQYALLKVEDPKTSLPKFVLINWQVESGQNLSSIRSLSLPGRVNPRCEEGLVRHALQRRGEISVGTPSDSQCQERGRAGHLDDPGQGVQGLRHFLQLQREATR